jgi:hypothetical protein
MKWGEVGNFGEQDGEMAGLTGGMGKIERKQDVGEHPAALFWGHRKLAFAREAPRNVSWRI